MLELEEAGSKVEAGRSCRRRNFGMSNGKSSGLELLATDVALLEVALPVVAAARRRRNLGMSNGRFSRCLLAMEMPLSDACSASPPSCRLITFLFCKRRRSFGASQGRSSAAAAVGVAAVADSSGDAFWELLFLGQIADRYKLYDVCF
jgi:hypothetical protein